MKMRTLFPLAVAALFVACGGGSSPKDVAEKFLTHIDKMEFKEAKQYSTKATGELLDAIGGMAAMMPKQDPKGFVIKEEKIDGDKATVTYRSNGKDSDETLNLVKESGKWLVVMSKEDMNKEGDAGAMDMDLEGDMDQGAEGEAVDMEEAAAQ
jgi:hypothetical protein